MTACRPSSRSSAPILSEPYDVVEGTFAVTVSSEDRRLVIQAFGELDLAAVTSSCRHVSEEVTLWWSST